MSLITTQSTPIPKPRMDSTEGLDSESIVMSPEEELAISKELESINPRWESYFREKTPEAGLEHWIAMTATEINRPRSKSLSVGKQRKRSLKFFRWENVSSSNCKQMYIG
ncbi:Hypothetical protein FKW44_024452 [Caligus rogercresseyi]|uniref:Uncharacterized protein n=1 Tax=Caligus rogercresseyi TaxID=217165 RepID=A0A7T8GMY3_CALRO|nr:Hypothetical protein FKW44_024452 [Caligus rogercresseyi]